MDTLFFDSLSVQQCACQLEGLKAKSMGLLVFEAWPIVSD